MEPTVAERLGLHRVVGDDRVLPQQADRLDASLPCQDTELEIDVEQLNIDASSMRRLRQARAGDLQAVREDLLTLVRRRGKLHNPVTNSGGMLCGRVRRAGARYRQAPAPGTRIASLASLSLTPLRLDELGTVERNSNIVTARGTAFLGPLMPWTTMPEDIPQSVALASFDVAGAPARVHARTRPGNRVLIVGAGHSGALSTMAAVRAGAAEVIVADVDAERLQQVAGLMADSATSKHAVIRAVRADATDAVDFAARVGEPVDLCASCVDVPEVELACVLATRTDGHILFFSMATNFARAALGAEGAGSGATLEIGNGLFPGHADFVVGLLRMHRGLWPLLAVPR